MVKNTHQVNNRLLFGSLIAILAGLWGIIVTIIFTLSQIEMISSGTPVNVVLRSYGLGFLYLVMHLIVFVIVTIFAYSAITARLLKNTWSKLIILVSIVFVGLSLIPGSTIGIFILPAALGMLTGGLLLRIGEKR
jgi:hypothetical protein